MELDFDKYCVVDGSPTTVLPASGNNKSNGKPMSENYIILPLHEDAAADDTRFDSVSCKRGSLYQSTEELRWLQSSDLRKKIEFSRETAPALPFQIIDSLCGLNEDVQPDMFLEMSFSDSQASVDHTVGSYSPASLINGSNNRHHPSYESSSPNPRFSRPRPSVKTRSHRSPLSIVSETCLTNDPALLHSPAHLHGLLRSRKRHGIPVFEFSVKSPEYVYIAKAWKAGNSLTTVYTFHSLSNKRSNGKNNNNNSSSNRESCMIGQMFVSCRLCTESSTSMLTEFVVYDIARSRKTAACSSHNAAVHPLPAAELHPGLEIAATVIEVPFKDRHKLRDLCHSDTDTGKIHAVIPVGIHGLPDTGSPGPSPLLERWRSGGECDCGGWDMACPLKVFSSQSYNNTAEVVLSVQGKADDLPVFSMRATEKEKHAVDFHAQLSTLQAFSISVAVLHSAEEERSRQNLFHDPQMLADAVGEDLKLSQQKMADEIMSSFMINPPFSPVARV